MAVSSSSISPIVLQALLFLYSRLQDATITWAITGSLGMALQGMQLEVEDIDLQSDRVGVYGIQMLFPEYVQIPVAYKESPRIQSYFGRLQIDDVQVEIMGDVVKRLPDSRWSTSPRLPTIIHHVTFREMRLPVIDLRYEYQAYLQMGRTARADEIKDYLDRNKE